MLYSHNSDGARSFPKYSEKIKEKNLNNITHLLRSNKRMTALIWETGLRGGMEKYNTKHK